MLQYTAIILIILTVVGLRWLWWREGVGKRGDIRHFWQNLRREIATLRREGLGSDPLLWLRLTYRLGLLSFALLALSGLLPLMITGGHLSGWLLLLHLLAAPVFALCLAVLALAGGYRLRLSADAWKTEKIGAESTRRPHPQTLMKLSAWAILLLGLPVIISIGLSMFPFYGTIGQNNLLLLHGFSGLLLTVVMAFHLYFLQQLLGQVVEPGDSTK
ncbi:MAG: hypothetical protein KDI38_20995 [Calditrichaeota bacterium]|nr:hypothetical protein [Calditrichota bacterium]MCB0306251.1 hypothetical protein [Calditrichota bacterium]